MHKMQSLFRLLVPKILPVQETGNQPRQAGERRVMSQDWRVTGPLPPPFLHLLGSLLVLAVLTRSGPAHPLPGSWLLPLSVTSPFTGSVPPSGPGQGELFNPGGAHLLRLPHPLCTGRGLDPKIGLPFSNHSVPSTVITHLQ